MTPHIFHRSGCKKKIITVKMYNDPGSVQEAVEDFFQKNGLAGRGADRTTTHRCLYPPQIPGAKKLRR